MKMCNSASATKVKIALYRNTLNSRELNWNKNDKNCFKNRMTDMWQQRTKSEKKSDDIILCVYLLLMCWHKNYKIIQTSMSHFTFQKWSTRCSRFNSFFCFSTKTNYEMKCEHWNKDIFSALCMGSEWWEMKCKIKLENYEQRLTKNPFLSSRDHRKRMKQSNQNLDQIHLKSNSTHAVNSWMKKSVIKDPHFQEIDVFFLQMFSSVEMHECPATSNVPNAWRLHCLELYILAHWSSDVLLWNIGLQLNEVLFLAPSVAFHY